jgi:hypothetical protein
MKITQKELDQAINDRLDRLDSLSAKFTQSDKNSFLTFDGKEFGFRKVNEILLSRVASQSDIESMESHSFSETKTIKSGFVSNFNVNNRANVNAPSQVVRLEGFPLFETKNDIKFTRQNGEEVLALDVLGMFYKYDLKERKLKYSLNLVDRIKSIFAITELLPNDITDVDMYANGFVFSVGTYGVFYADEKAGTLEVKFTEKNVRYVRSIGGGRFLLFTSDGNVVIYSFETGLKVETFLTLKKLGQTPKDVVLTNGKVFLLANSNGNLSSENLIHLWEMDAAGVSLQNSDKKLFPGFDSKRYLPKFISVDGENLYVTGTKDNIKLFVWIFDLKSLESEPREVIFDSFDIGRLNFTAVSEKEIVFSDSNNKLIFINWDGSIKKNINLKSASEVYNLIPGKLNEVIVSTKRDVKIFKVPEYRFESEINLKIFSSDKPCNNIDVLVRTTDGKEKVMFIDEETAMPIEPFFHLVNGEGTFAKILGSSAKEIIMKVSVSETTVIKEVLVKADRLYLK